MLVPGALTLLRLLLSSAGIEAVISCSLVGLLSCIPKLIVLIWVAGWADFIIHISTPWMVITIGFSLSVVSRSQVGTLDCSAVNPPSTAWSWAGCYIDTVAWGLGSLQ